MAPYRIGCIVQRIDDPPTVGRIIHWFDWRQSTDGTRVKPRNYFLPVNWIDGRIGFVAPQSVRPIKWR